MGQARRRLGLLGALCALTGAGAAVAAVRPSGADEALAKAAVLHPADFTLGSGWVETTPPSSTPSGRDSACAGASDTSGLTATGHAVSAFKAPGFYIQSWATVMQTESMVQLDWRRSIPFVLTCLRTSIRRSLESNTALTSIVELPFAKVAPMVRAYRATVAVTAFGKTIPMVADMLVYARGRTEFELLQVSPQAFAAEAKAAEQRIASLLSLRATA